MTNPAELRSSTLVSAGLLALLLTILVACGPGGGTEPPPDGDTSVTLTVTGPGRVVQGDFSCSGTCTWTGDGSEPVAFQAVPSTGNVLVAWGGVCPVLNEDCTRTFDDGDDVNVTFAPHAVRLDLTGDGEGLFRVAGGGVDETCDGDCGVAVATPLQLAVTYEADGTRGTTLGDWAGACAPATLDDYCLVTASGATNVGKTWRHPPVATSDGYTTWKDSALTVDAADGVLTNDTDTPGDPLTATVVENVDNGTLTLAADGGFDYQPAAGFEGQDDFTYLVEDAFGNEATATATIAVVDRVPAAANDAYDTTRNATLSVAAATGVLANDVDPDGDTLTAVLEDDVTDGTLDLADDGSFTYTPAPIFVGVDSFTYRASDGTTTGNLATVTITVTNGVPDSVSDAYTVVHDRTLTVTDVDGVLDNDTDPDGDPLTAELADGVDNGTLTLDPDGSFVYVPAADFVGTDTFTYVADDGIDASPTTTVTITVTNGVPVAAADAYTVVHDTILSVPAVDGVLDNDTDPNVDPLTASLDSDASEGTLSLASDGSFEYEPDAGFVGTDSFTYKADDGVATSAPATVTITVTNQAPTAGPNSYEVLHDTQLTIGAPGVLVNDGDADNDTITAQQVDAVDHGALSLDPAGGFSYTPNANFAGEDTFTYRASDGLATSATVTVTIDVTNQAPTAVDDSYVAVQGVPRIVTATAGVLENDSDPDGDALTANALSTPSNGSLTFDDENGSFTYTANASFTGTDSFTYQATDGVVFSAAATVTIDVQAVP